MATDLHYLPKFRDRLSYLYVEHAVVERDTNSIILHQESGSVAIPVAQIVLLMLGPGTTLTHAAVDILSRNNCLIAWVGEECVRLYAFGTGGSHSSERLLRQAALVSDPVKRLAVVRQLYQMRFDEPISPEMSIEQLRGKEGYRVRTAYAQMADRCGIKWEGRNYDRNVWQGADPANRALSAATACLYGVCHAAILSLGFSAALGFIHTGKQLSFVYDLADLYKLEIAVPVAFTEAASEAEQLDRRVRLKMRDRFRETNFMERVANDLMLIFGKDPDPIEPMIYDDDPALPAPLWDGEA
ncbi:MAG: type I-E CRISPR-associated endonuclease Cas1e [Fimbriimonas sp.]